MQNMETKYAELLGMFNRVHSNLTKLGLASKGQLFCYSKVLHLITLAAAHLSGRAAWVPQGSGLMRHQWIATPWMKSRTRHLVSSISR